MRGPFELRNALSYTSRGKIRNNIRSNSNCSKEETSSVKDLYSIIKINKPAAEKGV
jgi:hypothetical protein